MRLWWLHLPTTFQLWLSASGVYLAAHSACATIAHTSVLVCSSPLCESSIITEAVDTLVGFRQWFCSLRTLPLVAVPQPYYKGPRMRQDLHSHNVFCRRYQWSFRYSKVSWTTCSFTHSTAFLGAENLLPLWVCTISPRSLLPVGLYMVSARNVCQLEPEQGS